jgi:hypothetical protein
MIASRARLAILSFLVAAATPSRAHDGPPYPIVSDQVVGAYLVSIWTDPDATDDGSAEGKFWVVLDAGRRGQPVPPGTRAVVAIRALDRDAAAIARDASPVNDNPSRQYAALVMDHEGPFEVRVTLDGPLGRASVTSAVDATYDLRPAPALLFVYAAPFVGLGLLWIKILRARRRARARAAAGGVSDRR